ncbi:hypothetical protein BG004_002499 [Podila humilis]|nr:hypothetical protein BG004_002499 [Podila humilis]
MVGAERHTWVQQQFLGNCTYALPYHLSTPGKYWITNIQQTFNNFEGLDELAGKSMWPLVLNKKLLFESITEDEREFQACMDPAALLLPPELKVYIGSPSGAYQAVPTAPKTLEQAMNVDQYEWVPNSFSHPSKPPHLTMTNIRTMASAKAGFNNIFNCLVNTRRLVQFNGDSHIRVLYKSLVHQLQSLPGPVVMSHEYYFPPVRIGKVEVNYKFENHFEIVSKMLDAYEFKPDNDGAYLDWVQPSLNGEVNEEMQHFQELFKTLVYSDVLILGWGHWHSAMISQGGHWTTEAFMKRTELLLRRFLKISRHRRQYGMRPLVLAWAGLPASTQTFAKPDPNLQDSDWRTNQRLAYWDRLCNQLVDRLNTEEAVYQQQREVEQEAPAGPLSAYPAIVKLYAYDKTVPYLAYAADFHHFTRVNVVTAQLNELLPQLRRITGC